MAKIPKATFQKVLKEADPKIRVSDAAAEALTEAVGELAAEISRDAAELARHAKRKTILESDVRLAYKRFK